VPWGFPGRRACVAARSGREAGGVRCDGRCLDLAGSICAMPASATGGPSSPTIRVRVTPTVLGRSGRRPCRSRPGVSCPDRGAASEPVMRRRRASGRRGRRTGRRG
jgi:hypothetical protein